jgi:hypothetical protein
MTTPLGRRSKGFELMKKYIVLGVCASLAVLSAIALAAGGPPVPGTWYRSGPVSLGAGLYFTHITAALTAKAGGGQQTTESPTVTEVNQFTTVASANDSLTLSCNAAGQTRFITNAAASNAMKIFALTPGKINGIATATGYSLAAGKSALCIADVATSTTNACDWGCVGP